MPCKISFIVIVSQPLDRLSVIIFIKLDKQRSYDTQENQHRNDQCVHDYNVNGFSVVLLNGK